MAVCKLWILQRGKEARRGLPDGLLTREGGFGSVAREQFLPNLGQALDRVGTDYPFRAQVNHEDFGEALIKQISLNPRLLQHSRMR